MCLYAKDIKVADTDIPCYKLVQRANFLNRDERRKMALKYGVESRQTIYVTPYIFMPIKTGLHCAFDFRSTYIGEDGQPLFAPHVKIEENAYHSFSKLPAAIHTIKHLKECGVYGLTIFKAVIPKGSMYAAGESSVIGWTLEVYGTSEYASEKLKILDEMVDIDE